MKIVARVQKQNTKQGGEFSWNDQEVQTLLIYPSERGPFVVEGVPDWMSVQPTGCIASGCPDGTLCHAGGVKIQVAENDAATPREAVLVLRSATLKVCNNPNDFEYPLQIGRSSLQSKGGNFYNRVLIRQVGNPERVQRPEKEPSECEKALAIAEEELAALRALVVME